MRFIRPPFMLMSVRPTKKGRGPKAPPLPRSLAGESVAGHRRLGRVGRVVGLGLRHRQRGAVGGRGRTGRDAVGAGSPCWHPIAVLEPVASPPAPPVEVAAGAVAAAVAPVDAALLLESSASASASASPPLASLLVSWSAPLPWTVVVDSRVAAAVGDRALADADVGHRGLDHDGLDLGVARRRRWASRTQPWPNRPC